MGFLLRKFINTFKKGDKVLLLLCLISTAYGCLAVASATNYMGATRYLVIQIAAALIGVLCYVSISALDAEFFSEHRRGMVVFNTLLLSLLLVFGTDNGTGNKSWLDIPLLPFNIQPAEFCKITCILITASVMASHQTEVSSGKTLGLLILHFFLVGGLNYVLSRDMGVTLIFVFIMAGMALAGGIRLFWFVFGAGLIALVAPLAWNHILDDYQKLRIQILFDPALDAAGIGPRYHTMQSLHSLTGGGMSGQGLFEGHRTQTGGLLFAQHTDYIFSAIGEELGFLGCFAVVLLLTLIIARCIWVGTRSTDYLRRMICFGAASALIFQVISNVGMCLGITPVIGLTLPFFSYGGSSLMSIYAMLGLVSGVYARPNAVSHELYIRPPYPSIRGHHKRGLI